MQIKLFIVSVCVLMFMTNTMINSQTTCKIANCASCDTDGSWCTACSDDYQLLLNDCIKKDICKNDGCKECNITIPNVCTACNDGYTLFEGQCFNKDVCTEGASNCNKCDATNPNLCTSCASDKYKLINGKCYSQDDCTLIKGNGCKNCDSKLPFLCTACNPHYTLFAEQCYEDTLCHKFWTIGQFCLACNKTIPALCTECAANFKLVYGECVSSTECLSDILCIECNKENPKLCGNCIDGYKVGTNGHCLPNSFPDSAKSFTTSFATIALLSLTIVMVAYVGESN